MPSQRVAALTKEGEKKSQSQSDLEALIRKLRGALKGPDSLVEARDREHRMEK